MSDKRLTGLFVWRNVTKMYIPLESFLSVQEALDDAILCIDPTFPDDMELGRRICEKFPKARVVEFVWPTNVPGDGSRIGIASQFALAQASGDYCLNVQADEIYSPPLTEWLKTNWKRMAEMGLECARFKVLNLEHNMQQYQGGDDGSSWDFQCGAGYNMAIKLFKRCPAIRFSHDAWSMDNCHMIYHADISNTYPIVHAHDNFRDTLIQLRKTAATEIWTDKEKFGHYHATANTLEQTQSEWYNSPIWTQTESRFAYLLPEYVKPLLGTTKYRVRYELLEAY